MIRLMKVDVISDQKDLTNLGASHWASQVLVDEVRNTAVANSAKIIELPNLSKCYLAQFNIDVMHSQGDTIACMYADRPVYYYNYSTWVCITEAEYAKMQSRPKITILSRHPVAVAWIATQYPDHDIEHKTHLTDSDFNTLSGGTVVGTLPIHLVAKLNEHKIRYLHLSLTTPPELRGVEMTLEQFQICHPRIQEFKATLVEA